MHIDQPDDIAVQSTAASALTMNLRGRKGTRDEEQARSARTRQACRPSPQVQLPGARCNVRTDKALRHCSTAALTCGTHRVIGVVRREEGETSLALVHPETGGRNRGVRGWARRRRAWGAGRARRPRAGRLGTRRRRAGRLGAGRPRAGLWRRLVHCGVADKCEGHGLGTCLYAGLGSARWAGPGPL